MLARLLVVGTLLSWPLAAPAASEPLEPTAKWVVNFDDSQCLASRNYGTADSPLFLGFRQASPDKPTQLMVVRPDEVVEITEIPVILTTDAGLKFSAKMEQYASGDLEQQVYRVDLQREQFAALQGARALSVSSGDEINLSFALDEMQPLANVLDKCVADLAQASKTP